MTSAVTRFPFEKTLEQPTNDARQEFLFEVCDGLPPSRQKRLIVRAVMGEIGFVSSMDAEVVLDALGLVGE